MAGPHVADASVIEFFVPVLPRTTSRFKAFAARGVERRTVIVRENPGFINACKVTALRYRPARPLTGPLEVELTYCFRHPHDVTGLPAAPVTGRYGRLSIPDCGNIDKGILDAWEHILYDNDGQICRLVLSKVWVSRDAEVGTHVRITEFTVVPPWRA